MSKKNSNGQPNPNMAWFTDNPVAKNYIIHTAEDLAGLSHIVNGIDIEACNFAGKTITLGEDIDLFAYAVGDGWIPIGNFGGKPFFGTFDGGGHIISRLTINRSGVDYIGLFGYIGNCGLVKNVGLCDVNITGGSAVGAVAGCIVGSGLISVYSTGTIRGTKTDIGGIAGSVILKSSVTCSYSTCEIIGESGIAGNIGGIAGYVFNESNVISCAALNSKVVTGNTDTKTIGRVIGDIADINTALISNVAYAKMDTTANDAVGKFPVRNGIDFTAAQIQSDDTINGYFKIENGWTTQNSKLPGLGGKPVNLPEHLKRD